jgi:hypothetical protein
VARHKRRCRNCPETEQPTVAKSVAAAEADKTAAKKLSQSIVTSEGEGQKLWNHVLYGTGTCVGMMQGYFSLGMPGDPLPQLQQLIESLTALKDQIEKQHADRHPTK